MSTGVAVIGFGTIGREVAHRLARGTVPGLRLTAISARNLAALREEATGMAPPPQVTDLAGAIEAADIVVETASAAAFPEIARAVLQAGRILVPVSVSAIPGMPDLKARAERHGGRVIMPSGAMLGLDSVKAAAEDGISRALVRMRISPESLANEAYVKTRGFRFSADLPEPVLVFRGSVREAAAALPNHCNNPVTLAMAGIGEDRTEVEVIAESGLPGALVEVEMDAEVVSIRISSQNLPSKTTPRTSQIIAASVIATLRGIVAPIVVGT